jgi:hypothetical protein
MTAHTFNRTCTDFVDVALDALRSESPDWQAFGETFAGVLSHPDCPRDFRDGVLCRLVERCTNEVTRDLTEWPHFITIS